MAIDRSSQPIVKDAGGVLVGVAQVRIGKPSIRSAGTAYTPPTVLTAVGKSKKVKASTNSSVVIVKPADTYASNGGATPTLTLTGTYTGKNDGAFIIRAVSSGGVNTNEEDPSSAVAAKLEIFDTYGRLAYTSTALAIGTPVCTIQGVALTATFTTPQVGDTWIIPMWAANALNLYQTGIITPFSMFYNAAGSIGGLKSASFQPKIDSVKKLESGFPTYTADQIIDKVSVEISWSGYEYTNSNLALLKQMMARVINTGELSAISVEVVMRTRAGSPVRMWVPSATFTSLPTYAPTNDYSDVQFQMSALKQTEFSSITTSMGLDSLSSGELDIYNAWLSDANIYTELAY